VNVMWGLVAHNVIGVLRVFEVTPSVNHVNVMFEELI